MSDMDRCPHCGATYPVVMRKHCGGCNTSVVMGTFANPSIFGKPAFGLAAAATLAQQEPKNVR